MRYLEKILENLDSRPEHPFLQEARGGQLFGFPGEHLAGRIRRARTWLKAVGARKGDRVALLGANSAAWVVADLSILANGSIAVPLYGRSEPEEMAALITDADPRLVLVETAEQREALVAAGVSAAVRLLADLEGPEGPEDGESAEGAESAHGTGGACGEPPDRSGSDPVAILYTSGTSGEPKGVILDGDNLDFMLERTERRLDALMGKEPGPDRVFHYLPFCFAGSWLMLLLCLSRRSILTLNTDLSEIVEDLTLAKPHYFQNVPVLLERMRDGVTQALERRGVTRGLFRAAARAHLAGANGERPRGRDTLALSLARVLVFPKVRSRLGPRLRSLICGSAPLSRETQLFFDLLDIPVLQVYGLTETTAILTMDEPGHVVPGRVGTAVEGVELRLGEDDEIQARGPNTFRGYWNRPEQTAACFDGEWLRTGDQGEVDEAGCWRVIGRLKNLIVPTSGHNVAPEPLEQALAQRLPAAQQIVVIGDGRPYLSVIVTGDVEPGGLEAALEDLNAELPHYRRIRGSLIVRAPFGPETGLVTANGKLKRVAINQALAASIDELYERNAAVTA